MDRSQQLLRTPASDMAPLAIKVDLVLDEPTLEFYGDRAATQLLKADGRRLP